jgi:hypothetical protein
MPGGAWLRCRENEGRSARERVRVAEDFVYILEMIVGWCGLAGWA